MLQCRPLQRNSPGTALSHLNSLTDVDFHFKTLDPSHSRLCEASLLLWGSTRACLHREVGRWAWVVWVAAAPAPHSPSWHPREAGCEAGVGNGVEGAAGGDTGVCAGTGVGAGVEVVGVGVGTGASAGVEAAVAAAGVEWMEGAAPVSSSLRPVWVLAAIWEH
jgi:hypothetical protein